MWIPLCGGAGGGLTSLQWDSWSGTWVCSWLSIWFMHDDRCGWAESTLPDTLLDMCQGFDIFFGVLLSNSSLSTVSSCLCCAHCSMPQHAGSHPSEAHKPITTFQKEAASPHHLPNKSPEWNFLMNPHKP